MEAHAQPFTQQEYVQMIEKQKQLLYKEKNKNEERYLRLETLIRHPPKYASTTSSTINRNVPHAR